MSEVLRNEVRDNDGNIVNMADDSITAAGILRRIDEIICSHSHFIQAIEALKSIDVTDVQHGSGNAGRKADAIRDAVRAKEETNQKVIGFLQMMYEDIRPGRSAGRAEEKYRIIEKMSETLNNAVENENNDAVNQITHMIRDIYKD